MCSVGQKVVDSRNNIDFLAFIPFVFIVGLANLISLLDTVRSIATVRGSLCHRAVRSTSLALAHGMLVLSQLTLSFVIVILFSLLTVKYVKKHTYSIDNKKVVRDVLIVMVALATSLIIFPLMQYS